MKIHVDPQTVANERLYKEVSNELNIPETEVKAIVLQQAITIKKTIERGAFEDIRIVYLGAIKANHKFIQKMNDEIGKETIIKKILNGEKTKESKR